MVTTMTEAHMDAVNATIISPPVAMVVVVANSTNRSHQATAGRRDMAAVVMIHLLVATAVNKSLAMAVSRNPVMALEAVVVVVVAATDISKSHHMADDNKSLRMADDIKNRATDAKSKPAVTVTNKNPAMDDKSKPAAITANKNPAMALEVEAADMALAKRTRATVVAVNNKAPTALAVAAATRRNKAVATHPNPAATRRTTRTTTTRRNTRRNTARRTTIPRTRIGEATAVIARRTPTTTMTTSATSNSSSIARRRVMMRTAMMRGRGTDMAAAAVEVMEAVKVAVMEVVKVVDMVVAREVVMAAKSVERSIRDTEWSDSVRHEPVMNERI